MDWDKLRIFHAGAEAGSFTHARDHLRMSASAVSRQVSALERDLDVPLFTVQIGSTDLVRDRGRVIPSVLSCPPAEVATSGPPRNRAW